MQKSRQLKITYPENCGKKSWSSLYHLSLLIVVLSCRQGLGLVKVTVGGYGWVRVRDTVRVRVGLE